MSQCMPTIIFFFQSVKQQLFPYLNNSHSNKVLEVFSLKPYIKLYSDQLKNLQENEAQSFCFKLTLWPPAKVLVTESGIKG